MDGHIIQPAVNLQFCLRLPKVGIKFIYAGVVEPFFPSTKTNKLLSNQSHGKNKLLFTEDDEDTASVYGTNKISSVASTYLSPTQGGTTTSSTPSMSIFVGPKSSTYQQTTYCGELTFFYCQKPFFETFGPYQFLLNEKPTTSGPAACVT